MSLFIDSFAFGLAVVFIIIGIIGAVLPILPSALLIFLSIGFYSWHSGFAGPNVWQTVLLLLLTAIIGSCDFWLPMLGAKVSGGSRRAMIYGNIGGLIGLFFGFLLGSIIGYAGGVLLGSYQDSRDWNVAIKASLGSVAGRGIAMMVQLLGSIIILVLFVWAVFSAPI